MTTPEHGYIAAVGTFDGVHRGHAFLVEMLKREAAARGFRPKIITFADHPLRVVAPERCPGALSSTTERIERLKELGINDITILPFDRAMAACTAAEFLDILRTREDVRVLAMGFNNHIGSDRRRASELAPATAGIEIINFPELDSGSGVSSSAIREALAAGDVTKGAQLLGRPYQITGKVVGGKHLGRSIGFPTANIEVPDSSLILPADGVYAVDVVLPDRTVRRGMLNIGRRPTVDGESARRTVEVHIIDFEGDLYGRDLTLRLLARLRSERRFPSLDALTAQLALDRRQAREL